MVKHLKRRIKMKGGKKPCAWNLPQDFVKTSVTIRRASMDDKQHKSSYNTSIMELKMQCRTPIFNAHDTHTNMFLHSSIRYRGHVGSRRMPSLKIN